VIERISTACARASTAAATETSIVKTRRMYLEPISIRRVLGRKDNNPEVVGVVVWLG
jgi:hypothetical protein